MIGRKKNRKVKKVAKRIKTKEDVKLDFALLDGQKSIDRFTQAKLDRLRAIKKKERRINYPLVGTAQDEAS